MTFKLTIRSNPGSRVTADYECPEHGYFTATVERDANGDPPDEIRCESGHATVGDPPVEVFLGTACGRPSPWRPSRAGAVRVQRGAMVQGKSDARPDERHVMNTELLADGMPYDEWKARRAQVHRDESLRRVRQAFGKTPKVWSGPR